ncbi:MAG: hypothetical protein AAGL29_04965 [Bacteroidota bacterium]
MKKLLFYCGLLVMPCLQAQGLRALYNESQTAYETQDWNSFKKLNVKMLGIHPSHPTILYNTGIAYGKIGQRDSLVYYMNKILSWNAEINLEDDDLKAIDTDSTLTLQLSEVQKRYAAKIEQGEAFLKLKGNYHFEDLVHIGDDFYFTDVMNKAVIKANGVSLDTTLIKRFPISALSLVTDTEQKTVWISLAAVLHSSQYPIENQYQSYLVNLDVQTGKELSRITLPDSSIVGSLQLVNDKIYATSSKNPEVYVVDVKKGHLEQTHKIQEGFNLQGIAYDPKTKRIFVADYIRGIFHAPISNLEDRTWLSTPNYLLKGLDGLQVIDSKTLIASQNNSRPKRIIRINLDDTGKNATVELLENNLESTGEPTNLHIDTDGAVFYITNSAWTMYSGDLKPEKPHPGDQTVRRIRLSDVKK